MRRRPLRGAEAPQQRGQVERRGLLRERALRVGSEPIPEAQDVPLVELLEARPQRADVGNGGVHARHLAPPISQSGPFSTTEKQSPARG